ncbi:ArsR/SmtB family transcription factor [Streptomyces sp. NPDC003023]|uniref:ArsR/SmtB family transcription factor n=1 Tax=Streptomyces sp. NPDC003023 TaxID=3364675 RepID=UPI0036BBAC64
MASAADVLDALGDASRRAVLERLMDGPLAVGVLAEQLPISRPAVSQHLRVLKRAELVVESVSGTRRLYRINPAGVDALRGYLDSLWSTTLHNFTTLAEAEAASEAASETALKAASEAASSEGEPT